MKLIVDNNIFHGNYYEIFCFEIGTQVRLVDGSNPSEGRIQIKHNNAWGTVCENKFEESEARVICRMLGYDTV